MLLEKFIGRNLRLRVATCQATDCDWGMRNTSGMFSLFIANSLKISILIWEYEVFLSESLTYLDCMVGIVLDTLLAIPSHYIYLVKKRGGTLAR
jgi:hypothetical protein